MSIIDRIKGNPFEKLKKDDAWLYFTAAKQLHLLKVSKSNFLYMLTS